MLTITDNAAQAIKSIVEQSPLPEGAGMRISARPIDENQASLELSLAEGPAQQDEIVEDKEAHVFMEPQVAQFLDDKVLDANEEADGFRFSINEGEGPGGQPTV